MYTSRVPSEVRLDDQRAHDETTPIFFLFSLFFHHFSPLLHHTAAAAALLLLLLLLLLSCCCCCCCTSKCFHISLKCESTCFQIFHSKSNLRRAGLHILLVYQYYITSNIVYSVYIVDTVGTAHLIVSSPSHAPHHDVFEFHCC